MTSLTCFRWGLRPPLTDPFIASWETEITLGQRSTNTFSSFYGVVQRKHSNTFSHKSQTIVMCYTCMFIPVSVEELSPGSLCDLMRGKKLSLSFLSRPICSRKPWRGKSTGTAWSGWPWVGPDGAAVGGLLNADEESRWEGEQGRTRISGIEECWDLARNSKWEQLLANRAWRLNTGDLWRILWR